MRLFGQVAISLTLLCAYLFCAIAGPATAAPPSKQRDKALIEAVDKQDLAKVNALLAAGSDPNAKDAEDFSALAHAASVGSVQICDSLLRKGAKVDGDVVTVDTPLAVAIFEKHPAVVKLLLEHGANAARTLTKSGAIMDVAASTGQTDVMKMLIDKGAKIQLDRISGSFPLGVAASKGQKSAVELLLVQGAQIDAVNEEGMSALMQAAAGGFLEVVDLLIAHKAALGLANHDGDTALELAAGPQKDKIIAALKKVGATEPKPDLFRAVKKNDTPLLRALLDQGADPNEQDAEGKTPIFYSVLQRDVTILKILIEKGANPNAHDKSGMTPIKAAKQNNQRDAIMELLAAGGLSPEFDLSDAVESNDIKAVTALLDAKVDPNSEGMNSEMPLATACAAGYLEIARLLVSRGANINAADKRGSTPLISAVSAGRLAEARFLLEKGADAKVTQQDGENALMFVRDPGALEMVRLLVEHGAVVRAKTKDFKRTVLTMMATSSNASTLQYLLEHGAREDINAKDDSGGTPLGDAASGLNVEAVQTLLANGADPTIADSRGETPVHLAVYSIARFMREPDQDPVSPDAPPPPASPGLDQDILHPKKTEKKRRDFRAVGAAVIRLLVKHGAKLEVRNAAGRTPMEAALKWDCWEAVDALRLVGARLPAPQGPKNLAEAADEDDLQAVRRLLAKGANLNTPDQLGFTPLMTAALRGDLEIVKELLNHGAKPDYRPLQKGGVLTTTALLLAAENGHNDIVRLLLKHGANPNAHIDISVSPLTEVIGEGQWESVKILVEAGIDINAGEKAGITPLLRAVYLIDGGDIVPYLISKGAHVNGKFGSGYTPLMAAAEAGKLGNLKLLLKAGADITAKSDDGNTALLYAVKSGNADVARFVLEAFTHAHGDINAHNQEKKTALSVALDNRFEEITQLLKEAGATE